MESKQRAAFAPLFVTHFGLERIAEVATETWLFSALYSRTRASNRFVLLLRTLDLLRQRRAPGSLWPEIPRLPHLRACGGADGTVSTESLSRAIPELPANSPAATELTSVQRWSQAVDATTRENQHNVAVFPGAAEAIHAIAEAAELVVVSQTPTDVLVDEWQYAGLADNVSALYGQYPGGKAHVLSELIAATPGRPVLMVGDAPGDYAAAAAAGTAFFPIVPGGEAESWHRFRAEVLPQFLHGEYTDAVQARYTAPFEAALPKEPQWQTY
jgi:phosphoglycolate phosphatase-like HAD superfamily hydrolase